MYLIIYCTFILMLVSDHKKDQKVKPKLFKWYRMFLDLHKCWIQIKTYLSKCHQNGSHHEHYFSEVPLVCVCGKKKKKTNLYILICSCKQLC